MKLKDLPIGLYKSDVYRTIIFNLYDGEYKEIFEADPSKISDYDPIKDLELSPNLELDTENRIKYYSNPHEWFYCEKGFIDVIKTFDIWGIDNLNNFHAENYIVYIHHIYNNYNELENVGFVYYFLEYIIPKIKSFEELWVLFRTMLLYKYKLDNLFNLFLINNKVWHFLPYYVKYKLFDDTILEKINTFQDDIYLYEQYLNIVYLAYPERNFQILNMKYPNLYSVHIPTYPLMSIITNENFVFSKKLYFEYSDNFVKIKNEGLDMFEHLVLNMIDGYSYINHGFQSETHSDSKLLATFKTFEGFNIINYYNMIIGDTSVFGHRCHIMARGLILSVFYHELKDILEEKYNWSDITYYTDGYDEISGNYLEVLKSCVIKGLHYIAIYNQN